ncbi:MAG: hypothetical protein FJ041_05045, partial [Candidatus Cloacimonetes bacterium]|nr:hypothetical protein [Candidatus Cloacimonadota bacterium]
MKTIAILILIVIPVLIFSVTRTVSLDGTQQYTSIQSAINACSNGDVVLVYPGRYIENINLNGRSITIASRYSQDPLQAYIDSTIIDGNLGVSIEIESGENAVINGFTIVNNEQNQNPGFISGIGGGGGIRVKSSTALIKNCIIRNCIANYGAGISVSSNANATLENNRIYQNRALCLGGGLLFSNGNSLIFNNNHLNSIYDNSAAAGMDIYIGWMENYPNTTNIVLDIGSRELTEPDNYFINVAQASVTVNIAQGFFTVIDGDVYISPDGNDNNDGITSLTPFKTIKHALQVIKSNPGNPRTVHLSTGTYGFNYNGELLPLSLKPNVRIVGSGTGQTIIDGELNNTFFAGWNMEDVYVSDISFINGRSNNTHPVEIIDCSDIELRNLIFSNNHGYLTNGIYLLRSNEVILENLTIGNTNFSMDVEFKTIATYSCSNVFINGVISHDNINTHINCNSIGLYFDYSDIILRNTILCNNSATDAYLILYQNVYPEDSDKNLDMSNVLVYNNNITNCNWAFAPVYLQNRYQSMKINNCTFAGNQGSGYFSAIFAYADIADLISYNPQFTSEMYLRNHVWNVHTGQYVDADVNIRNSLFRT